MASLERTRWLDEVRCIISTGMKYLFVVVYFCREWLVRVTDEQIQFVSVT